MIAATYSLITESSQFAGSSVTVSWDYYNTRGRLIDGDIVSNAGWSSGMGNTFPLSVDIHFPGPRLVNSVTLISVRDASDGLPAAYGESFSLHGVTDFKVYSGSTLLATVTDNNWVTRTVMFDPITTPALRVEINGSLADSGLRQIMAGVAYYNAANGYAPQIWPLSSMLNYALLIPEVRVTGEDMGFETLEEATTAFNAAQAQLAVNQALQAAAGIATLPKITMKIQSALPGTMVPIAWYSGPAAVGVWKDEDARVPDLLDSLAGAIIDLVTGATTIDTAIMCYDPTPWLHYVDFQLGQLPEIVVGVMSDYVIQPVGDVIGRFGQLIRDADPKPFNFLFQQSGPTAGGGIILPGKQ